MGSSPVRSATPTPAIAGFFGSIRDSPFIKIIDFGLALASPRAPDGRLKPVTRQGSAFGTVPYTAPEQIEGSQEIDHRADLYSLGVILYQLLTGKLPMGHWARPSEACAAPPALDRVVERALAYHPADRFQTAQQVLDVLRCTLAMAQGESPK